MVVRAPLVQTQQDGSIRVADLAPVVMTGSCFGLPKQRLVPFVAECHVSDADDCPSALDVSSPLRSLSARQSVPCRHQRDDGWHIEAQRKLDWSGRRALARTIRPA